MTGRRDLALIAGFGLAYALAAVSVGNSYYQLIMTVVPVWAVMGLAWNLLSGYSGLISFGHAAFFGIGAYAVALGLIEWGISPWLGIPAATVLGALAGLLVGIPTFRLRGHYFALAMLAYPLALLYIFEWLGYQEVALPMMRDSPAAFMQFDDHRVYGLLALGFLIVAMLITRAVERSRFGLSLIAIKENEPAAEAAGIDTLRWKLRAITLSGAIAAAIGGFYAVVLLVVTPPAVFGMLVSAQALIVAMFGGVATVWGPVIGALILVPTSELLHAALGHVIPGIQGVIYGIAIVATILLAPDGVVWRLRDLARPRAAPAALPTAAFAEMAPAMARTPPAVEAPPAIEVRGVSKAFGGLKAIDDVSLVVRQGEILGVIGPNGAGKTTLFNLLNGFLRPDAGAILLDGAPVVGRKPNRICRAGVGRTFQVVRPFPRMTVADNVVVGAFVHARTDAVARAAAAEALAHVGLASHAHIVAGALSTKHHRLMELARALAGRPKVLLLDETLAGLGAPEIEEMIAVIRRLAAAGTTIVIIEHTMGAMVRLVDRFVVLDHGAVLAEGTPAEITRDQRVIEAYLGKKWLEHA
jgi:ABC-type branched-subunit amino acid transport system ATPase component/ABC-type branched-subunit amino acid transport system permease subunit